MIEDASRRTFLIEIAPREGLPDPEGEEVARSLREFGLLSVDTVRASRLYEVEGALGVDECERAAREVFSDPIVERFEVREVRSPGPPLAAEPAPRPPLLTLTVLRRPGVMDPVVASALKALRDEGFGDRVSRVRTARRYRISGSLSPSERETAERRVLANPLIEDVLEGDLPLPPVVEPRPVRPARVEVPLADLERRSREEGLALSPLEVEAIAAHYRAAGRSPTDVELETIAQTWSEHCKHKTVAGPVLYEGPLGDALAPRGVRRYGNLLRETIVRATRELERSDFCLSVFADNAGVVALDPALGVCMKVETHNHPSALEPYGGAGTGVGGVIRDILGTGLGAKPIANTDVFCFGPPDLPRERVPEGALHPLKVLRGVVAGVRDYGNRMGIPTVSGALFFDERYVGNPLVFCGTVGLIPRERIAKAPSAGDLVLVCGGRTGRDGIHGATFSSLELTHSSERRSSGAVQIGNPIEEKRLLDALMEARDRGLFRAVTDCGAGGLSSAVGEMAATIGAEVDLSAVPLKYEGLTPAEIWVSEAQERMVLAVPPERLEECLRVLAAEGVEGTVIGRFTGDARLRLLYGALEVGSLDLRFLHEGLPRAQSPARFEPAAVPAPSPQDYAPRPLEPPSPGSGLGGPPSSEPRHGLYDADLLAILSSPNVCSKEWVIRQYDFEVQGTSAVKPLVGAAEDGPSDAAVLAPVRGAPKGIALSCGMNPLYGELDPFRMAQAAVDEALRNAVAVGADPERAALLDNFAWADTARPEELGSLVLAAEGASQAALALGAPFISGKDSLRNEFRTREGRRIAIPPTLLISCLAIHPDVGRAVTADLKGPGDLLYLIGRTGEELGGSHFHLVRGLRGGRVPAADLALARKTFRALHAAMRARLVLACHDLSEGGLAAAAAEMALAGRIGLALDLGPLGFPAPVALFAESCSRFLVEVPEDAVPGFEAALAGVPISL